jgi:phosphoenolpyruvate carboxylase
LLTATRGTSQMVEEFETLTLVHKALDLKTRDLVELGAFQGGSAIELILLLEDVKEACVEYFRTAAVSDRVVENMRVFLGISDSATSAWTYSIGEYTRCNR